MTVWPTALRLDRVGLNVGDLEAATAFYIDALDFEATPERNADPILAGLLGVRALRSVTLRRGQQRIELTASDPPGAPYPAVRRSDDLSFQHCALVTNDIDSAYDRLARHRYAPISRQGPQALPGGIIAFKFRDPEGHPLELIQFPRPGQRTTGGIDHSAICVSNPEVSVAFYRERLGLTVRARQINTGPAQDSLDDIENVAVEVISIVPEWPSPHVELLGYRRPARSPIRTIPRPSDLVASRLVFATTAFGREECVAVRADGVHVRLIHDPDGHAFLLEHRP